MTYRVVTSHLIGGTSWGYLPDEAEPEYASRQEAIDAAVAQADELVMEHHDSAEVCDEEDGVMTVVWEDEYPRGRRFEVVEHV